MKLFFRSSHEMSVKIFRQSQLFSVLSCKFLVAFLLNSLSVKSSWLEHLVLKHKKKRWGNIFGHKYILCILEYKQRAMHSTSIH